MSNTSIRRDGGKRLYPVREVMKLICAELQAGKLLSDICADNRNYPSAATVYNWVAEDPAVASVYRAAMLARNLHRLSN